MSVHKFRSSADIAFSYIQHCLCISFSASLADRSAGAFAEDEAMRPCCTAESMGRKINPVGSIEPAALQVLVTTSCYPTQKTLFGQVPNLAPTFWPLPIKYSISLLCDNVLNSGIVELCTHLLAVKELGQHIFRTKGAHTLT